MPKKVEHLYNLAIEDVELNNLYNKMIEITNMMEQAESHMATLWATLTCALKRQWVIVGDELYGCTCPVMPNCNYTKNIAHHMSTTVNS